MELHVWLNDDYIRHVHPEEMFHSLDAAETALSQRRKRVDTTQTHVFSTVYLEKGYRLFAHMIDSEVIEVTLGQNECTNREIRVAHNIEKLLLAGEFGMSTRYDTLPFSMWTEETKRTTAEWSRLNTENE